MKNLSTETKGVLKGMSFAVIIVCVVCFSANAFAKGDRQPTKADYESLEIIKKNQITIEKTREAHEQFLEAKLSNEKEVQGLNSAGWNVQWETMKLIPSFR